MRAGPHLSCRNLPTFATFRHHGILPGKPSEYRPRFLHHLSREFHPISVHKAAHNDSARFPRWLLMDAQVAPTNYALQGTYLCLALGVYIYSRSLDVYPKIFGAIQRNERSKNTPRYQRRRL